MVLLAAVLAACLPDPVDVFAATGERPADPCPSWLAVGEGRWEIAAEIWESRSATVPGELAPVALHVRLPEEPSEHLIDMHLELKVSAGQASPGHVLSLQLDGEPLQEATFEGPHDNEAQFNVELPRDVCGTPCEFTLGLSAEPAPLNVPVPLKLMGELSAFVDSKRGCADQRLHVAVHDAR